MSPSIYRFSRHKKKRTSEKRRGRGEKSKNYWSDSEWNSGARLPRNSSLLKLLKINGFSIIHTRFAYRSQISVRREKGRALNGMRKGDEATQRRKIGYLYLLCEARLDSANDLWLLRPHWALFIWNCPRKSNENAIVSRPSRDVPFIYFTYVLYREHEPRAAEHTFFGTSIK